MLENDAKALGLKSFLDIPLSNQMMDFLFEASEFDIDFIVNGDSLYDLWS